MLHVVNQLVRKVHPVRLDQLVQLVRLDHRVLLVLKEMLEHKEILVLKDYKDKMEISEEQHLIIHLILLQVQQTRELVL